MMIVRNNKWNFVGEVWGKLVFENIQFPDEWIFVTEAKYIDVANNNSYHLKATPPQHDVSYIPYERKHFSECVVDRPSTKATTALATMDK